MYTNVAGLFPPGGQSPLFNQLYIYQSSEANQRRMENHHTDGCLSEVMEVISSVLDAINPYAHLYKSMAQKYNEERDLAASAGREPSEVRLFLRTGPDRRRYNLPDHDEVGVIFVGDEGAPSKPPDIVVYTKQDQLRHVSMLSPNSDPLSFPLFYPSGHPGWSPGIAHVGQNRTAARNKITALQYCTYHWADRPGIFNPQLHGRDVTQQKFVVDYVRVA